MSAHVNDWFAEQLRTAFDRVGTERAPHACGICDAPLRYVGEAAGLGHEYHCTAGCYEEGNAHYSIDCCDERPEFGGPVRRGCPDGGRCHHGCGPGGRCWRVDSCGPLSGVFPDDEWPTEVHDAEALLPDRGHL